MTPSYNQGEFIEETLRSVLQQAYPNLEYIVIDGGSTDGSVEIIRKYEPHLTFWVSEPDRGQGHAINKGLQQASGEIVAWINSDDLYAAGAIHEAVSALEEHPDASIVYSDCDIIDASGRQRGKCRTREMDFVFLLKSIGTFYIPQPTVFMRRKAIDQSGCLSERFHLLLDYELWFRILRFGKALYLPGVHLATMRHYSGAKTFRDNHKQGEEYLMLYDSILRDPGTPRIPASAKRSAYAYAYLRCAMSAFRENRAYLDGVGWFARALMTHPPFTATFLSRKIFRAVVEGAGWRLSR